jgi:hypothetical protein
MLLKARQIVAVRRQRSVGPYNATPLVADAGGFGEVIELLVLGAHRL